MKSEFKWIILYFILLFFGELLFFGIIKVDSEITGQVLGLTLMLCGIVCYVEARIIEYDKNYKKVKK